MNNSAGHVVIDTNVYLSYFFSAGRTISSSFYLAYSRFKVLQSVHTYNKIEEKMNLKALQNNCDKNDVDDYLRAIRNNSIFISVIASIKACPDKIDNKFIDLAVTGAADYIVTGDHLLLNMKNFKGVGHTVQIISPAGFVRAFQESSAFAPLGRQYHMLKQFDS
jgi:putative PIN family toxin of toxin-antitoxin system